MKILIAGGTGFLGKALAAYLINCGVEVNVLSRRKVCERDAISYYRWDVENKYIDIKAFDGVDSIVNMTGVNIGEKRWTTKRKIEIIESRITPIQLLLSYVDELHMHIETFISSSAVGFYGALTSQKILMETDDSGHDFLSSVCKQWESSALEFHDVAKRVVILRKGVVFGKDGGLYRKMIPLAKIGINVSMGTGLQFLPWIDIRDLVRLYYFILTESGINGIFNAVATQHITMNDFAKYLLSSHNKSSFLPNIPAFLVKLLTGELSDMLLYGSRVSNQKLLDAGFIFNYSKFNDVG
jgi:uncharacterized protein